MTALLPADLGSLEDEANKLIVVEELRDYLRMVGPGEQFFFIDACRDMPYEKSPPSLGSLGFGGRMPVGPRSQSTLYAVSELGQAREPIDGNSAMTEHLVAGLEGSGRALDYSYEDPPGYVVTMESVRNYVHARLEEVEAGWEPVLVRTDPPPQPLRRVADPPSRYLAVHVTPDEAFDGTEVTIGFGPSAPLVSLPPEANHSVVELEPRRCELTAESTVGIVDPASRGIDPREEDEATVRVNSGAPDGKGLMAVSAGGPTWVSATRALHFGGEIAAEAAGDVPPKGRLEASAAHSLHAVHAIGLEPPYLEAKDFGRLSREVPAGAYRVEFRQEPHLLAVGEVFVADGSEIAIAAPEEDASDSYLEVPAITLQRFTRDVLAEVDTQPIYNVAIAVAIERGGYSRRGIGGTLDGLSVTARGRFPTLRTGIETQRMPWGQLGFARIGVAGQPFELGLKGSAVGNVRFSSMALPGFTTVVTLSIGTAGEIDLSQMLVPRGVGGETGEVELFQVCQGLYKTGDLLTAPVADPLVRAAEEGSLDPILGCMALHSAAAADEAQDSDQLFLSYVKEQLKVVADLPDARVALAASGAGDREELLEPLLANGIEPLLDRSAAVLAAYAVETGRRKHPLVARRRLVAPGDAWNLVRGRPRGHRIKQPIGDGLLRY